MLDKIASRYIPNFPMYYIVLYCIFVNGMRSDIPFIKPILIGWEQKWFISVKGESEKTAIEVWLVCGLRAHAATKPKFTVKLQHSLHGIQLVT